MDDRRSTSARARRSSAPARRLDIKLPHLCYTPKPGYRPDGNCRVCMVEIEGERVLAASCIRTPTPGMKVKTQTDRAKTARRMVAELLITDQPRSGARARSGQRALEDRQAPEDRARPLPQARADQGAAARPQPRRDGGQSRRLHPVQSLRPRLPRGAGQRRDRHGRPRPSRKDRVRLRRPDGRLDLRRLRRMRAGLPDRRADAVDDGRREQRLSRASPTARSTASARIAASAASSPTRSRTTRSSPSPARTARPTQNRLCVKGRFGFDYVHNPQRLLKPMIRKDGVPKVPHEFIDPSNPWTHFREATWEEALDRAAGGLKKIRDRDGPKALAGFGSAKGSNEEAYLFQKLVRTGFGTNNVDHCTRLCHASSVAALLEGVGSAAVTATFNECKNSDVIIVIGANPTENHPVAATFFKQAAKRGAKLVVMDPRGQALKRHAWKMMQFKNGTDVAMLNAMLNVIVDGEALRPAIHPDLRRRLRRLEGEHQGLHAGGDGADLRHRGRHAARSRARLRPRRERDHLLGHGRVAAHPRHRQRALPDRAVADHRPDRPARHRAASAARPEQRAGRVRRRPDPDVLPRLQVGGESGDPRASTRRPGA